MVFDWYPEDLRSVMQRSSTDNDVDADCTAVPVLTSRDSKLTLLHIILGLCFLHKCGVIHNDLKPDNIMLNHYQSERYQLEATIADLGLAHVSAPTIATSKRRLKKHNYEAPDPDFSTKVDIWSFAMLAFHLIFVANTGKRLTKPEFDFIKTYAANRQGVRVFIRGRLPSEDYFFIEALVQCLHLHPEWRPTAKVLCEVLLAGEAYTDVCNAAHYMRKRIDSPNYHLEEMIFLDWYENVFMAKIIQAKEQFSNEIITTLGGFGQTQDFPLTAVINNFESEMHQRFADVL